MKNIITRRKISPAPQQRTGARPFFRRYVISFLLLIAMLFSASSGLALTDSYIDMETHWARQEVEKWSGLGILKGADGSFRPDDFITRGDMAVIIDRIMKYQTASPNKFSDLDNAYYTDAVLKLNHAGIFTGEGNNIRAKDPITRQETAVVLSRLFSFTESEKINTVFSDYANVSDWAAGYINTMVNKGYISGFGGRLYPENNITRAEAVKLLDNIISKIYDRPGTYSDTINGNVIINTNGIIIGNSVISGDLIVSPGLTGKLVLLNAEVKGNLVVYSSAGSIVSIEGTYGIHHIISSNETIVKILEEVKEDAEEEAQTEPAVSPTPSASPDENSNSSRESSSGGSAGNQENNLPKPEITTTLVDGAVQQSRKKTFEVWAKDANGVKIDSTVTLNGTPVAVNWDDTTKTSFTLIFGEDNTGDNIIEISATDSNGATAKVKYNIIYQKAEPGEVIGKAVWSVEAFTIGMGYIIPPEEYDIIEGETSAQMLERILTQAGYEWESSGSVESAYYLIKIKDGSARLNLDPQIPEVLQAVLPLSMTSYDPLDFQEGSLGEFDFTNGSGWMYCLNNVFPNVGFADSYLSDGDVVRVQYTLAYGMDNGGYGALGDSDIDSMFYPVADKDKLIKKIAETGFENCPLDVQVIAQKIDAGQGEVNSALRSLD